MTTVISPAKTAARPPGSRSQASRRWPVAGHHGRRAQPGARRQPGRRRPRRRLRRGRRHARRGLPGHRRARRPLRRAPRLRHAARRVGIVGTAIGMAMNGLVPVVEMQFDAFAYPAFEQITSHLAKLRNRTRGTARAPDRHPHPLRRRHRRGRAPQRLVGGLLHAHPGPARGDAGHPRRRLPPAAPGDRLPRPGHLPRAEAPLLVQGDRRPDAGRPADRPRGRPAPGHATSPSSPTARWSPPRWRPPRPPPRKAGTSRSSTCARCRRSTTRP